MPGQIWVCCLQANTLRAVLSLQPRLFLLTSGSVFLQGLSKGLAVYVCVCVLPADAPKIKLEVHIQHCSQMNLLCLKNLSIQAKFSQCFHEQRASAKRLGCSQHRIKEMVSLGGRGKKGSWRELFSSFSPLLFLWVIFFKNVFWKGIRRGAPLENVSCFEGGLNKQMITTPINPLCLQPAESICLLAVELPTSKGKLIRQTNT